MMPLPSEEVTPPVTNMYFVLLITGCESTEKLIASNGECMKKLMIKCNAAQRYSYDFTKDVK